MLVAQTSIGVVRVEGEYAHILDVGGASLSDLIRSEALSRLDAAPVTNVVARDRVTYRAPVPLPGEVVIVGLNYKDHAAEVGMPLPAVPRIHLAAGSAVTDPDDDIPLPGLAPAHVDFEGEMAVVMGTVADDVSPDTAWSHVAGVTIANDVTARDVQDGSNPAVAGANVGLAKAFKGFKPLGPAMLTADEMRDGRELHLRTLVDAEVRQDSSTAELYFSVAELVSQISRYVTLLPGDVVLTGTPGGVGVTAGRFLSAGQVVEVELEGVGLLRNRVVAAPSTGGHVPTQPGK